MSDWEYSDVGCPKCCNDLAWRRCHSCGGEGSYEDDDGVNDLGFEACEDCKGTGHEEWCRACGWDNVFKCFLQPKYEAEWLATQKAV